VTNLVFTFVGLWLNRPSRRRTLLYIGSFGYIASLGLTAWAFFTERYAIVPGCIFRLHRRSMPLARARSSGCSSPKFSQTPSAAARRWAAFTHWIFAALLTTFFPGMVAMFKPGYVFLFFCGMMVFATRVGEVDGDRDERRAPRTNRTSTHRHAQTGCRDCPHFPFSRSVLREGVVKFKLVASANSCGICCPANANSVRAGELRFATPPRSAPRPA